MKINLNPNLVFNSLKGLANVGKVGKKVLIPAGVLAVGGIGAAGKGGLDILHGKRSRKAAEERQTDALARFEALRVQTEQVVVEYGEYQVLVQSRTIGRLADWLERNERQVRRLNFKRVSGITVRVTKVLEFKRNYDEVAQGLAGVVAALGAGAAAPAGALWGVAAFGTAGTGAQIAALGGVAAENAMFAWLGGGPIAAGGGGMAAGAGVLGLVTILPILVIGGATIGVAGAKQKRRGKEHAANIDLEIGRIETSEVLLVALQERVLELRMVLERLESSASIALTKLDSVDFDPNLHAELFLEAYQLSVAVREVLNAKVLDSESGELNPAVLKIIRKFS